MPKKKTTSKISTGVYHRSFEFSREAINEEARTVELSFSSETREVERWYGIEILDHSPGSVRLGRLQNKAPLLLDHAREKQLGVVEDVTIGTDRTGRAVVRFGKSALADEIFQDVLDGIRTKVSVDYRTYKAVLEEENADKADVYRVIDWEPYELSIVSVPADDSVGVGRNEDATDKTFLIVERSNTVNKCPHCQRDLKENETCTCKTQERTTTPPATPPVDVSVVENNAAKKERQRIADITAIGESQKMPDLARQFIDNGGTLDQFRAAVIEKMPGVTAVETSPDIGLTDKETREFSMNKIIHALAMPGNRQAAEAAAFEFEASEAVGKKMGKDARGFYLPNEVMRGTIKRDLVVGTATAGGNLVATDLTGFIDLLRNRMKIVQLGAQVLTGLVGNLAIPELTGGATSYWVTENAAPTESEQTFGQVPLTPKTVGAYTDIGRRLILQTSLDVEAIVRADLATQLALAIDLAAINGSGTSNQPTGILNTTGIGDVAGGTNGAAPTYTHMIELETDVAAANADVDGMGLLTSPEIRGKLKTTQRFTSTDTPVWEGKEVNGYRAEVSNQIPKTLVKGSSSDCHAIIFGNFRDLMIGQWGVLDILVDPYTGGAAGTARVRVLQDVDVAVRHAASFSAMKDARNI